MKLGLRDVEYRLYPGGRHEMLHETNRAEVTLDVLDWLERHMPDNQQKQATREFQQVHQI